jgi:hypothetical protein
MMKRSILFSAVAMAFAASTAVAGTKFATNLVPSDPTHPPANPTLSPKGQLKLSDKGAVAASLAGVTDAGGLLVNTSTVYADSVKLDPSNPDLDGSEYIVLIKIYIPSIVGLLPPGPKTVEVPVPVDLKTGKGKTKLDLGPVLAFIPGGFGRSVEIVGAEVWGPVGAQAAACEMVLEPNPPAEFGSDPPSTTCRGGTQIGVSGLSIPLP